VETSKIDHGLEKTNETRDHVACHSMSSSIDLSIVIEMIRGIEMDQPELIDLKTPTMRESWMRVRREPKAGIGRFDHNLAA
jgi:hypothetical protein